MTDDEVRSGRPKTAVTVENVDSMHEAILSERRLGLKRIAERVGISVERVHHIAYKGLGIRKLCAK